MKRCLYLFFLLVFANAIWAQSDAVKLGEAKVECSADAGADNLYKYVVTIPVADDSLHINIPKIDGVEVVMGPNVSITTSYTEVNGHTSKTTSTSFTYILNLKEQKLYEIPSFNIYNNRHTEYYVVPMYIINGEQSVHVTDTVAHRHVGDSIFIEWTASKKRMYVGDTVRCTCTIYVLKGVDLTELEGIDYPCPDNCIIDEGDLQSEKMLQDTLYNGKKCRYVKWQEFIATPTSAGKMTLGGNRYKAKILDLSSGIDPFEAFFNGESYYSERQETLKSRELTINVLPNDDDDKVTLDNEGNGTYVLLDVSSSMKFLDYNPDRLHCAKQLAKGIITALPDAGFMSYDAKPEYFKAYGAEKVNEALEYIDTLANAVNDGTSLSDALVYPLLKTGNVKNMVVVSDGLDNCAHLSLNTAMDILHKSGISVSMVYVNSYRDSVACKVTLDNDTTVSDDNDTTIVLAHDTIMNAYNDLLDQKNINKLTRQLKKTGGQLYIVKSEDMLASLLPKIIGNLQRKKNVAKHPQFSKRLIDGLKKRIQ